MIFAPGVIFQAVILDGKKQVVRRMPQAGASAAARRSVRASGDNETRLDDVAYPYIAYSASGSAEVC